MLCFMISTLYTVDSYSSLLYLGEESPEILRFLLAKNSRSTYLGLVFAIFKDSSWSLSLTIILPVLKPVLLCFGGDFSSSNVTAVIDFGTSTIVVRVLNLRLVG